MSCLTASPLTCPSDRAVTQSRLLLKSVCEDGRRSLSGVRTAHICRLIVGVENAVWGFSKVSAVRNEDDKGADNRKIWPVSGS